MVWFVWWFSFRARWGLFIVHCTSWAAHIYFGWRMCCFFCFFFCSEQLSFTGIIEAEKTCAAIAKKTKTNEKNASTLIAIHNSQKLQWIAAAATAASFFYYGSDLQQCRFNYFVFLLLFMLMYLSIANIFRTNHLNCSYSYRLVFKWVLRYRGWLESGEHRGSKSNTMFLILTIPLEKRRMISGQEVKREAKEWSMMLEL